MLPDMSEVLEEWESPVKLKVVTITSVDFIESVDVVVTEIQAVVQPADKTKINIGALNWSKKYILIHKRGTGIAMNNFIEHNGRDFKIIGPNGDYEDYGYIEMVGEETKETLLVAT
jgi:hypothetical protein